jgi:hypothetical protein
MFLVWALRVLATVVIASAIAVLVSSHRSPRAVTRATAEIIARFPGHVEISLGLLRHPVERRELLRAAPVLVRAMEDALTKWSLASK